VYFPPTIKTRYSMMNPRHWRKQLGRPSICMSRAKEGQTFIDLGRIKGRTIRIRERRGLNHLLIGEVHSNQNRESSVSIRFLGQMGKGLDNLLSVGDVEEITFIGFVLGKVKVQ